MKKLKQLFIAALVIVSALSTDCLPQQFIPNNIPVDNSINLDKSETAITVDPNNPNHLMATWNDFSDPSGYSKPGITFSTNGGNTWLTPETIQPSSKYPYGYDPSCAIDIYGNEYYTYGSSDQFGDQGPIYISIIKNDNLSSILTYQVSTQLYNQDKPYMTLDNKTGKIYVSWVSLGPNTINFAYSSDGKNWNTPQTGILDQTSNSDPPSAISKSPRKHTTQITSLVAQDPIPVVAPNGDVYVVWDETYDNGGTGFIKIKKSTDGGIHFISVVQNDIIASITAVHDIEWGTLRISSAPSIAIDPTTGNICVAYTQYDSGNLHIFSTTSTDGGSTWSFPFPAASGPTNYQFFPWLSAGPEGTISLIYYQGNLNNQSYSVDTYLIQSYDGGMTFYSPYFRITSTSSNPFINKNGEASDYIGLVSAPGFKIYPLWTDFRSQSNPDIFIAPIQNTLEHYGGILTQNVTIPQGITWGFDPGVTLTFQNNSSFTVNGTLTAQGTSTNPITFNFTSPNSSTQNGIKFNSGSSGNLNYCNVQNAYRGIGCWGSMPTISNCTITNNTTGIYLYGITSNTSQPVQYNTINNNTSFGIYLYNSYGWIYNNQIRNNSSAGIDCYYYSSPMLTNNIITGNYFGISASTYCSPSIGSNVIKSNSYGIMAGYCNNIYMGGYHYLGYNSVYSNTYYAINAQYAGTIYAEYNWWGQYPPGSSQFYLVSSTLDDSYALSSDPNSGRSIASQENKFQNPVIQSTNLQVGGESFTVDSTSNELSEAVQLEMQKDYNNAIVKYSDVFNKELNSNKGISALIGIRECYDLSGKKGFDNYLNNTVATKNKNKNALAVVTLEMLNHSLIENQNYSEAVNNMLSIKDNMTLNSDIEKENLFNLGYAYQNYMNDKTNASIYLNELINKYPDDLITQQAKLLLGEENNSDQQNNMVKKTTEDNIINLPNDFALTQNYPNPFNPTTIISYQIPTNGFVLLKVFDALGREVKTLVNESKGKGSYNVSFNASSLPSGIYFYQLRAGDYISTKKMVLLK